MAKLHIICGNCECNDMWEWVHHPEEICEGEVMSNEDTSLYCGNCSTIHSINNNAKLKDK